MTDPLCGTYAGWNRHNREGTPFCRPCKDANAAYHRAYRAAHGIGRHVSYPTTLTPDTVAAGLGAVIARGFRENA